MSTSALIAYYDAKKNSVNTIRVACDGYASHTGNILLEQYNTEYKVRRLIKVGDLFGIGAKIPSKMPTAKEYWDAYTNTKGANAWQYKREECFPLRFYQFSRGEEHKASSFVVDSDPMNLRGISEWHYYFVNGKWHIAKFSKCRFVGWIPLTEKLIKKLDP